MGDSMYGRNRIYTDNLEINNENLLAELEKAYLKHTVNRTEIDKLYDYFKGKQDIINKVKDIRENINNKICVNHASEIVNFKLGYTLGEPIQYIRRGTEVNNDDVMVLNDYMIDADKVGADRDLGEWLFVSGVGYRLVLPSEPFDIYTLDPRNTFVVYHNGLGETPVMGVTYVVNEKKEVVFSVYTKDKYYKVTRNKQITSSKPHSLGMIPIIEYNANNARLGAFEIVLDLLDALNLAESNRLDDMVQFVNNFLCISGATLDEETFNSINEFKMLGLPENSDAKYLTTSLQQSDVQTFINDLYTRILTITGLPNRNNESGGSSDNGVAVYLREGFQQAETQALAFEQMFKRSEKKFLNLVLRIIRDIEGTELTTKDLEIKFARRYTDNILTKTQAMIQLLDAGIAPSIAISTSGIWNDSYSVFEESKPFLEKWSVTDVRNNG